MSEKPPLGWSESKIADITLPVSQSGPDRHQETFYYIDLASIDNRSKKIVAPKRLSFSQAPSRAKQIIRQGDVLFSNVRVYLENVAEIPEHLESGIASTAFCVLRPSLGINSRYLYHFAGSKPFVLKVNSLARGNSPPSVQDGDVRSRPIPIPPEAEQERIACKIDELFSDIEEGARALARVRMLVEQYRQSVLKAAVTGELTRNWRKQHAHQLESGQALLTRILAARREAWEQSELTRMALEGERPRDKRWRLRYEEPETFDPTSLTALPTGWTWASLSQLSWASGYGTSQKCAYDAPGPPVLRIPNIRQARLDLSDLKSSTSQLGLRSADLLRRGDLLVIRTNGSPDILGIGVALETDPPFDCYFASYAIRFRLVFPDELAPWVNICWQTGLVRSFIDRRKATSAGQYNISQTSLFELCLPIPPENERREACDRVLQALSRTDGASKDQNISLLAAGLRQSILHAAFTGKLVPQDPTDEPAAILLERIAAERAATVPKPRSPRQPRSKKAKP